MAVSLAAFLVCTAIGAHAGGQATAGLNGRGAEVALVQTLRGAQAVHTLSLAALATLPQLTREVRLHSDHGDDVAQWSGPLLWDVLAGGGVVDPAKTAEQVREVVRVTGADGYQAVFALAEISPAFAGRPILLALRRDGGSLPGNGVRLVVPDEHRAGRSVRDVVRIEVQ